MIKEHFRNLTALLCAALIFVGTGIGSANVNASKADYENIFSYEDFERAFWSGGLDSGIITDTVNGATVTSDIKYSYSATITDVTLSSSKATFSGNTMTLNSAPSSGTDIELFIKNAISGTTATYSVTMNLGYSAQITIKEPDTVIDGVVMETGSVRIDTDISQRKVDLPSVSDLISGYNLYKSGGKYYVDLPIYVSPVQTRYPLLSQYCSFDSGVSQNRTFEVVFSEGAVPTGVTVSNSSLTIPVNGHGSIYASVTPSNAFATTLIYTSSNTSIATVDKNGIVYGEKEGKAVITVTEPISGASVLVDVKVGGDNIYIKGNKTINMTVGDTYDFKCRYTIYSDITNVKEQWESADPSIVSITADGGKATAKKAGTTTIKVRIAGTDIYSSPVTIVVTEAQPTGIFVSPAALSMKAGETSSVDVTIMPDNADRTVTWTTSNAKVATVSNGKITAVAAGTATITAKTVNGLTAKVTVTVTAKDVAATGVTLNKTSLTLTEGNSETLTATVSPSNATDKALTWSTSNSAVATVSNGKITAVKAGTATITAKTANGKTATCKVTVTAKEAAVTSISLNKTSLTLNEGGSEALTATVSPSNATNKTVTWSTSNSAVAIVSGGKITAVKAGTATITAKTANGKTAACTVAVTAAEILPESLKLTKASVEVEEGKQVSVGLVVYPAEATNKKVTWTSSDTSIATVGNGGVVKGVKPGKVTITATAVANGISASYTVTVKEATVDIAIPATITAYVGGTINFSDMTVITPGDVVTANDLTWSSSNTDVGTISGTNFTAKNVGKTVVTAKYGNKSSSCAVVVKSESDSALMDSITQYKFSQKALTGQVGEIISLRLYIYPHTIKQADLDINWTSSDLSTVYVTSSGDAVIKKPGTVTITASLPNGLTASCSIVAEKASEYEVYPDIQAILDYEKQNIYMEIGDTVKLDYHLSDPNVDKSKVHVQYYVSSLDNPLQLNPDKSVTAIGPGAATINLYTLNSDGTRTLSQCSIYVRYNEQQLEARRLEFANEILDLCNAERAKEGLKPLQLMDDLNFAAQIRTDEQTEMRDIDHIRPDGTNWYTVLQNVNVPALAKGENLIINYGTAESVVRGWMSSPGHRANIMREKFTHMGIGVSFTGTTYTYSYIVTQIFIQYNG